MLTDELSILALYGLIVALTLVAQASGALGQLGMGYMLSARDDNLGASGLPGRLERALNNSVTTLALVAPPILILGLRDAYSAQSLLAAQAFLVARILYLPAYILGIPLMRTLVWTIGFAATLALYWFCLR